MTDSGNLLTIAATRDRVKNGRYQISENVLRLVTAGEISVIDIEQAVGSGIIIEIHKHSQRRRSFLVCGRSATKPFHVICADGEDDSLVILVAYVPSPPVWKDAINRGDTRGTFMSAGLRSCYFCGGPLKDITVGNFDYRFEGQLYVIKKVPASLCRQCGEKYLSAEVARKITERIAAREYIGKEEVHVVEYH